MAEDTKKKKVITQDDIMKMLNACYDKSLTGLKKVSPPVSVLGDEYLEE